MGRATRIVRRLASGFNRRRYERVMGELGVQPADRILELGCGRAGRAIARYNRTNEILGIDVLPPARVTVDQPNFRYQRLDASDLGSIPDDAFDVAVSFGMLEHILERERLVAAIRETQRVAGRYAFVVPHPYAFIEPHFLLPLFPQWPDAAKAFAVRHIGFGSQPRDPEGRWHVQWPAAAAWRELFDDPNLRIASHWYGPVLLDYLIFGGRGLPPRRGA